MMDEPLPGKTPVNRRRSHQKSRLGCGNCKKRRVKCDEKKPICSNCNIHDVQCTFSYGGAYVSALTRPSTHFRFRPYQHTNEELKSNNITKEDQTEVSTKSVGTQCELDLKPTKNDHQVHSSISLADLQLFHHFITSTSRTISDDEGSHKLWQIHVAEWSMNFSPIMHLILALSALHQGYQSPRERLEYVQSADSYFVFGLRSVRAVLAHLDAENCQKVYLSAVLICFIYFARGPKPGEYLVFSENGPAEWRVLMDGVKSILESHRSEVFSGILTPNPSFTKPTISASLHREMNSYFAHLEEARVLVEQKISAKLEHSMYNLAIENLVTTAKEVYEKRSAKVSPVGFMQVLMGWVYRLPVEFVGRFEQQEPVSLVVLAYWAVLLKEMQSVWFMENWDSHVMTGIYMSLPGRFHTWLEWPMQQIRQSMK